MWFTQEMYVNGKRKCKGHLEYQRMTTTWLKGCRAKDSACADEPSLDSTCISSRSSKILSICSAAPDRWATLQHTAWILRYSGFGKGRFDSVWNVIGFVWNSRRYSSPGAQIT